MHIRAYRPGDEAAICAIYNHYIRETTVTFETEALSVAQMAERIAQYVQHYPWLVCEEQGQVTGYSYASRFHQRAAYRHTVECSVYVAHQAHARGMGRALYTQLLAYLQEHTDCHSVLGVIALPNAPSVALHEQLGFEKVAHLNEVGRKFERWIDVGFWQKKMDWPRRA